ncbi:quinate permease [Myriangium duriaei CBS 260.36]|uniref:Quinate transporter n=1 Tax=Myriangium duriaei CBS 260.36 TaxID=1168546 RepID=A0A9P4MPK9_9PEZI|nr:quinate permease [Myriangium duriaei CBS 260.36]
MGLLTLVEDRPTPKAVYNWRVYACAAVASCASMMIGYDSAFIGTTIALPSFTQAFKFSTMSADHLALVKENIVSVYQAGAFFGSLMAYCTSYFIGRKWGLTFWSLVFCIGAAMTCAVQGPGLGLLIGGRVIAGLGVGGTSMIVPIYISELAPPAIRGRLVGMYELGWQIGGLVGFWINYGLSTTMAPSHKQWLIPFAVQLIPAGLLFIGSFWLHESPRWLINKNRRAQALKNLQWIRQLPADDIYIVEEVAFMDAAIAEQEAAIGHGFWSPFKAVWYSRALQWRFLLGTLLFMFQNGSGINAINYYSPTVFKSIGIQGTNNSFLTTGIFGVVKTCITFVWLFILIDKVGRRNLLMIGGGGGAICMYIIGAYIKLAKFNTKNTKLSPGGVAAIFFFYLWTAFYTPTWNGTPWVLNSEMFDNNTRALGQASAAASNWFWNFLISRFTSNMFLKMGRNGYGVYIFFASMMILSIIFVFFVVPETKSVPLERMDRLFSIRPVRKAHKTVMAEVRAEEEDFRHDVDGAGLSIEKTNLEHVEKADHVHNRV